MRLFVALPVPSPVQASMYEGLSLLRGETLRGETLRGETLKGETLKGKSKRRGASGFSWVRQENLHITILFLGEREKQEIHQIKEALAGACSGFSRFQISYRGLGFFPPKGSPRVLFVRIEKGSDEIGLLYRSIALHPLFKNSDSLGRFNPHITTARIKKKLDTSISILSSEKKWNEHIHGTFTADRVVLYRSDLHGDGARYTAEAEVFLGETGQNRIIHQRIDSYELEQKRNR